MALGTDLNGMAEQIPGSEFELPYPTFEIRNADWSEDPTPGLLKFMMGFPLKEFDIRQHGIAHVGMLPDFLAVTRQHAATLPDPFRRVGELDQIFHSAHDFIATWEKAERASAGVNASLPAATIDRVLVIRVGHGRPEVRQREDHGLQEGER